MKLAAVAAFAVSAVLTAQDNPADQLKHLYILTDSSLRPVSIAAANIETGLHYPSVIHLTGNVEIRTPVCLPKNPGTGQTGVKQTSECDGSMVLRADAADFHEDTGQIEATGNVKITRERRLGARAQ